AQLQAAAQLPGPRWLGYSVAGVPGHRDGCGIAYLETGNTVTGEQTSPVMETARPLAILYRLDQGRVDHVRTFDLACEIDAGGMAVRWLDGVPPDQNASVLSSLADTAGSGALAALGESDGPAAEAALEHFLEPSHADAIRRQAAFWLGSTRGHAGFLALQKVARTPGGSSDALRNRVTFALSLSRDPDALNELIRMAKSDPAPAVRGQAIFWLAQKADRKAIGAISDAVANDPATSVKERAVFGLSQLPHGDGVPLLIQVAQSNSNPAVRKKAMFWLGQSKDPRALVFFEKVLEPKG
ncbi:MAG: HEAT repeat domain-containing protein, partial [Terriglobales bacterium]